MKKRRVSFEDAARSISPSAPAWLTSFLVFWGARVAEEIKIQPTLPTKRALHRQLIDVAEAAERVADFLDNGMAMLFLEAESNTEIEHILLVQIQLRAFANAAKTAAESSAIFASEGKVKRGRGKARATKFISPKNFCALVIKEAWLHLRGHPPPPNSKNAADAARAFWLACDGAAGWGDDPRTGWNGSFEEVDLDTYRSMRNELKRSLREHSANHSKHSQIRPR
jgi:hypothetical protein